MIGWGVPSLIARAGRSSQRYIRCVGSIAELGQLGDASPMIVGQPTPETHPYLLQPGEIQPGISSDEFQNRRQVFANQMESGGIAIVGSSPTTYMSGIIPYPYRPNSCFQYLTGIIQPDILATIGSNGHFTVYCPDPSEFRDTWNGSLLSKEAALQVFGADEAFYVSEMPRQLHKALSQSQQLYLDLNANTTHLMSADHWRHALSLINEVRENHSIVSLDPIVHRMRWKKSKAEIALMEISASIAAEGIIDCMKNTSNDTTEHHLSALFEYHCRAKGAQRMSYPPVVGSGPDACTIHYSRNDKRLQDGTMVLMDAGCEYYGYCSDVTRTWPISGNFEGAQKDVYQAVFEAHQSLLAECKPGNTLRKLHSMSVDMLQQGLRSLACTSALQSLFISKTYRKFYPHSVGHWLGLDTHDCPAVSHDLPMEPGVILTIEPGLYIPDEVAYGHFRGIGVRIEDDVCIQETGPAHILSSGVPCEMKEIESLIQEGPHAAKNLGPP